MTRARLATLKFVALLFLLPGLAGLIGSAMLSTYYLDNLPRAMASVELRTIPRNINGTVVYQTEQEDQRLTAMEYASVGIFVMGLGLGLVYLERWGNIKAMEPDEDDLTPESNR